MNTINIREIRQEDDHAIAKVMAELSTSVSVSPDRSVARIGAISVEPLPQLASSH